MLLFIKLLSLQLLNLGIKFDFFLLVLTYYLLLVLNLFLPGELLAQGMRFCILPLLYKSFKDLLVLEELRGLLEAEGLVQLALVILAQLDQLGHVRLF